MRQDVYLRSVRFMYKFLIFVHYLRRYINNILVDMTFYNYLFISTKLKSAYLDVSTFDAGI